MKEQPEETQPKHTVNNFAKEALHDLTHFDSKFFKTLIPLIAKPGFLTNAAFTAQQKNYVKPLALFVFINFLFFIFKTKGIFQYSLPTYEDVALFKRTIAEHLAASRLSPAIFTERFNTSMKFEQQEYVIVMIPLFALFLQLLYFKQRQGYVQHLIFALHFYSFAIIFLMVLPYLLLAINYFIDLTKVFHSETFSAIVISIVLVPYLFFAVKSVYKQNLILSFIKAILSTSCFFFLIVLVYRYLLFYVVMHSMLE